MTNEEKAILMKNRSSPPEVTIFEEKPAGISIDDIRELNGISIEADFSFGSIIGEGIICIYE